MSDRKYTDQPCPECEAEGRDGVVVIYSYDAVNNAWDARCSQRCGWTS